MTLFLLLVVVLLIGLTAAAALGRLGFRPEDGMAAATGTQSFRGLPGGRIDPEQFEDLGFDRALRGYRMNQVDDVIDRLRTELRERDEEIAELRAEPRRRLAAVPDPESQG